MLGVVHKLPSIHEPSPLLLAFVKRLTRNLQLHAGPDRRAEARDHVAIPARVQPIDEHGGTLGPPIAMVARSISTSGIGLVHEQPMRHDRLVIGLLVEGEEVILAGEVRWRGSLGPFYSFGCEVMTRLDHFPAPQAPVVNPTPTGTNLGEGSPVGAASQTVCLQDHNSARETTSAIAETAHRPKNNTGG